MSFFESNREAQRDIIWKLYKDKDSSLALESNEVYKKCEEMKDLYPVYQRFIINKKRTQFWLCERCEDKSQIVYAIEGSKKSHLVRHCRNNHKNKQKLVTTSITDYMKSVEVKKPSVIKQKKFFEAARVPRPQGSSCSRRQSQWESA